MEPSTPENEDGQVESFTVFELEGLFRKFNGLSPSSSVGRLESVEGLLRPLTLSTTPTEQEAPSWLIDTMVAEVVRNGPRTRIVRLGHFGFPSRVAMVATLAALGIGGSTVGLSLATGGGLSGLAGSLLGPVNLVHQGPAFPKTSGSTVKSSNATTGGASAGTPSSGGENFSISRTASYLSATSLSGSSSSGTPTAPTAGSGLPAQSQSTSTGTPSVPSQGAASTSNVSAGAPSNAGGNVPANVNSTPASQVSFSSSVGAAAGADAATHTTILVPVKPPTTPTTAPATTTTLAPFEGGDAGGNAGLRKSL